MAGVLDSAPPPFVALHARWQIGLFAALGSPFATPSYLRTLGPAAEERGFHSVWAAEHVVLFDEYTSAYPYAADGRIPARGESGFLDPFLALSFIAAGTRTLRLGTGICLVPQRNPVYTAKAVSDLDWMSGGRVDFGVGVGWLAEEFRALGVPFERRGARCRAYLRLMQRLWSDPVSCYESRCPPAGSIRSRSSSRIRRFISAARATRRSSASPISARAGTASTSGQTRPPPACAVLTSCSPRAAARVARCRSASART